MQKYKRLKVKARKWVVRTAGTSNLSKLIFCQLKEYREIRKYRNVSYLLVGEFPADWLFYDVVVVEFLEFLEFYILVLL